MPQLDFNEQPCCRNAKIFAERALILLSHLREHRLAEVKRPFSGPLDFLEGLQGALLTY